MLFQGGHSQDATVYEISKEFDSPYHPPTIQLFKESIRLDSTSLNIKANFIYTQLGPGNYKLVFSGRGQQTKIIDNIIVEDQQVLKLTIRMKGPCLYDHPDNYIPVCPENRADKILPIAYGLIVRLKSKDNENQEPDSHSGGCVTTGCDPKFYCTIHKIEF